MRGDRRTGDIDSHQLRSIGELVDFLAYDPCSCDAGEKTKSSEVFVLFLFVAVVTPVQVVRKVSVSHNVNVCILDVVD